MTIYGLILTLCLVDSNCYQTVPAVYESEQECVNEVAHQRAQGVPKTMMHCELMEN